MVSDNPGLQSSCLAAVVTGQGVWRVLSCRHKTADMPSMTEQEVKGVENCHGIELLSK